MFLILITNLMLHIKYQEEVESYFLLILPIMANFLLNAIWTWVFLLEKNRLWATREIIVNLLFFGATLIILFMYLGIMPAVCNLESLLVYLILVEVYIFGIALELSQ